MCFFSYRCQAPQPCNVGNSKENTDMISIYSKHSTIYYHLPHLIQLTGAKKFEFHRPSALKQSQPKDDCMV